MSENDAESPKIVENTPGMITPMDPAHQGRNWTQHEWRNWILGSWRNNSKTVDFTVTNEWKWLFVNGIHKVYVRQLKRFVIFLYTYGRHVSVVMKPSDCHCIYTNHLPILFIYTYCIDFNGLLVFVYLQVCKLCKHSYMVNEHLHILYEVIPLCTDSVYSHY